MDEAARWFADRDAGLLDDDTALREWLAADPRHARAFAEMEAVWSEMAGMNASPAVRASLPSPATRWRKADVRHAARRRWVPAALAASLAVVMIGAANDWPTRFQADAMTATGERRTVSLPDGSQVVLNTHSAIAVDYSGARRVVRLLTGEAAFTVSPDARRPFTVEANGGEATALGTRFVVRRDGAETRVTVTEHRVRVAYPVDGAAVKLEEGQSIAYDAHGGLGRARAVDAADAEAWRQGLLVFENRPLSEVVAEIGRYHPGFATVLGDDVRARRVSGVFNIDDPVGALAKLQRSLGLRSARITDRVIFIFA